MNYLFEIFKSSLYGKELPEEPKWNRWVHVFIGKSHCRECLALSGCWFLKEKTPKWPHHLFCHCVLENIPFKDVQNKTSANSSYSKFDPYLFDTLGVYGHGKDKLFKSWGFSVEDAPYLKKEIERQGLEKYISGEYTLGKLNKEGQRISIMIEIARKDNKDKVTFLSGWMVCENGQIRLTTPYGGK